MNRRRFLATSGFAAAGLSLWGCTTQEPAAVSTAASGAAPAPPTAAGAVHSAEVTLVSHEAPDLARHWHRAALPTRATRAGAPAAPLAAGVGAVGAVGATILGVTGLDAAHGALSVSWIHAQRNLPFGLWYAHVAGDELHQSAPTRQRLQAQSGTVRLQWQLGAAKRELVFGQAVALTRGLFAVPLLPEVGERSPLLWVALDSTTEPLWSASAS